MADTCYSDMLIVFFARAVVENVDISINGVKLSYVCNGEESSIALCNVQAQIS